MIRPTLLVLFATTVLTAAAHAAPNLLTNGSFESFSGGTVTNGSTYGSSLVITGWTTSTAPAPGYTATNPSPGTGVGIQQTPGTTLYGGTIVSADDASSISSDAAGSHAAYFVDDQAVETLSQSIQLTAGSSYSVGFDYYQVTTGNPNPFTLTATFGGQTVTTATSAIPTDIWFNAAQTFTPQTTGLYTFNFTYMSGGAPAADALVDRVYVQQVPGSSTSVPEPMSLALLGTGLAATMIRRRSTQTIRLGPNVAR